MSLIHLPTTKIKGIGRWQGDHNWDFLKTFCFEVEKKKSYTMLFQIRIQKVFGPIVLLKLPPTLLNIDDRRANVTTTMLEESISVYCGVMPVGLRS